MHHSRAVRALIVEDNPDQASLLERWLSLQEVSEVEVARSSADGVRLATTGGWDIVVADLEMPDGSGMDVVRTSKARHPHTPALIVTAHASVQAATDALRCRADDFLQKPLRAAQFLGKVKELLVTARRAHPQQRVLAIGAHFDDVEIGCGGLLCRHAQAGDQITSLVLTDGSSGGEHSLRRREAEAACSRLRGELVTAGLPDTRLTGGPETIESIARVIANVDPTVIYTHTRFDTHQDHRSTHDATLVAARGVGSLFCYQAPSTTTEFRPTRFVDISDQLEGKLELLQHYESQLHRPYMDPDVIRSTARYWGRFSGYGHVEALEVVRAVEYAGGHVNTKEK